MCKASAAALLMSTNQTFPIGLNVQLPTSGDYRLKLTGSNKIHKAVTYKVTLKTTKGD